MKYLKVLFDTKSRYSDFEYKMDEINIAKTWNKNGETPKEMGGINFSDEENIIRWIHNGNMICDVIVPEDSEVVRVMSSATPGGVYRANKVILTNKRMVTDDMAMEFYNKTKIPESAFPKALGGVSIMNYKNTALKILKDKVNASNIDYYLEEWNDFIDKKDRKYDSDLASLETERNAIKQEMETLKTVAKENVERTFRLFS